MMKDWKKLKTLTTWAALSAQIMEHRKEISSRIPKASYLLPTKNVWKNSKININTQIKIYKSNVKAVLLYGAETWRITKEGMNKHSAFHNSCLRIICKIYWPMKISNKDLHQKHRKQLYRQKYLKEDGDGLCIS